MKKDEIVKPFRCPTPGCEESFIYKWELDRHFKENKICGKMAKHIKELAKKGSKFI